MTAVWNSSETQTYLSPQEKRLLLARLLQEKASRTKSCHPLSYGQQALWFLYQSAPESPAYNTAFPVRIRSHVDVTALRSAFQALTDRHPSLRTTWTMRDGEPVQEVHGYQEVCFEEIDASTWTWDELNQKVVEAYQRPFDLEREPVLRVSLFTRSECDRLLLLTIHHIASDGWSLWMLLEELRVLYSAYKAGQKASLPPLALSYTDYINWQTKLLASSAGEHLWNYWQNQLAGELPVLNLPTDRPRLPMGTTRGASHAFKLDRELTQQLKGLAQTERATLYMTLLAAFQVLLYRYTSQEDILVGSPTAGRNQSEFAGIVGYFVNPVVLRSNLSGNPTFREFLSQVRQTVLDAIAHQDYPFSLLVKRLQPNRDASRSPLFQTLFVLQQPHKKELAELLTPSETEARVDWGGLDLEFFAMPTEEGQFDLALEMVEAKESLFALFKYSADLFDATTITRMAEHFQTLVKGIVANPDRHLSDLPLLTAAEEHTLLVTWNDTQEEYPKDICLHQLFETQVERTPDAVAVVFQGEQLTYRELNCRANQLAQYLQKQGVKPEVLVGICVERSLEMVIGLLGILKAGGAYVPLDPAYPQERLAFMLEDAQVSVLLTQQSLVSGLPSGQARVLCLDADWEVISQHTEDNAISAVRACNLAYVIYTSGSTGKPKGTMIVHQGLVNYLSWCTKAYAVADGSGAPVNSSIGFDATITSLFSPLLVGQKVVLLPESQEIESLCEALRQERNFSLVKITPAHLEMLSQLLPGKSTATQTKAFIIGGEALSGKSVSFWQAHAPHTKLINEYGPTETVVGCCVYEVSAQTSLSGSIPIGRPIANTQLYILDQYLQPVPIGVFGELHIGGAGVARGYLNRPELTAEKFIANPFSHEEGARLYKTGDLARYLPDGNIEFLGRIDHQVKIRGFRIELGEIEAALSQYPLVQEAVVIAREDIPGNKHLVAYVIPNQKQPTSSELRHFLKEKLPDYMVPSAFVMLSVLPLTPNGKVDRRALPTPDTSRIREASFVPPRDSLERQLAQIWEEILDVRPIGVRDNFFEFGGHSLLAVRLMAQIQQQFGKNLPLATLFQNATVEQLATVIRQQVDSLSWSPLVAVQPGGSKQPFFCMPGAGGNVIYFYDLARQLGSDQPFYGLQAMGLDGESQPHTRIEDMAADYIEALKTVQPQGPYFLGGHSSGGLVAFEMAQQLQKQGCEVALVAILDAEAPIPGRHPIGADWDDAKWLMRISSVIERFVGKNLGISYEALQSLEPDEQLNYIGERLKAIDLLPPEAGIEQVRGLVRVFQANYQASAHYVPQKVYPTRIALFRASEIYPDDTVNDELSEIRREPTWGWNHFSVEPVEIHVVPGDHITMMASPHVQVLAERLRVYLDSKV